MNAMEARNLASSVMNRTTNDPKEYAMSIIVAAASKGLRFVWIPARDNVKDDAKLKLLSNHLQSLGYHVKLDHGVSGRPANSLYVSW